MNGGKQMNRSVTMRNIRQILKLNKEDKLSNRRIAQSLKCSHSTIGWVLKRAEEIKLSWPLPETMTDTELENTFYPPANEKSRKDEVDMNYVHKELKRKGVTLMLLWQEYKSTSANPLEYSRFCENYRQWCKKLDVSMHQNHKAGEKVFVDWAGMVLWITNQKTGSKTEAYIYVAVLGASNYTYAQVCPNMTLVQWISCHVNTFEFFKGVPEILVPDNLKTGVKKPCFYEPDLNKTYLDMASHYDTVIIPARVRKPKDKAKAEVSVQIVERQIMAALRNYTFFSVEEANTAVWEELVKLNERPMQKIKESRKDIYTTVDYPALKPLPQRKFNFAEYKTAKVSFDYHIEIENNFYSVSYQLVGQKVEARYSWDTVEVLFKGQRIAIHQRSYGKRDYVTLPEHRPEKHNSVYKWPPERIIDWAAKVGPYTAELVKKVIEQKMHFEQAYRQCRGIIRLGEEYGAQRVEDASHRALTYGSYSYKSLMSILQKGLDKQPLNNEGSAAILTHKNIRGPEYYKNSGGGL